MTEGKKLSFGIKTAPQHTTYEDMLRVWQEADSLPSIEHAWLFDHFMPLGNDFTGPCLEGWTLLSAYAALTKRVRIGLMVTGNTYRHPAVLANMAATVDIISGGRLDFGIGAGWNEREHNSYGIPLYTTGERIRRLGEACEIIKRMWSETAPDFAGKYYQIKEAYCEPKPVQKPYPPFVIGGSGEKLTLRIVAQYASIWNFVGGGPEIFQQRSAVLDKHCAAIGRDPQTIQRSIQSLVNPANLEETRSMLQAYIQAGATHLILSLRAPYPEGIVHRLDEEIIKPFKAAFED
ncbi:LLM class F420-dependent oxidoreductase [Ktedonosporobacter rubrisoli]|uniref:LLM class F420-dependent oxidoreductase n=1 Tax=Ktedonosporobacter rubrisoli TaxID=2509675 RepID=A0A4V0YYC4_KTERU|nr:LLM class F420-dependent oxidoreductase [Ktedonosporobacter rubrisoli]QBD75731.1 LLM class F420-dependent oxidoreductase [Ktedonosporobacter rubrisoli]